MPERHLDSILDKFRKKAVKTEVESVDEGTLIPILHRDEIPIDVGKTAPEAPPEMAFTEEENKRLEGYLLLAKEKERAGDQRGAYELYVKYKKEFIEIKAKIGKDSAEPFPPEYVEMLSEVFKGEKLDLTAMPKAEDLTKEYFDKMYPVKQRAEDTARGLTSYRPDWWAETADAAFTISEKEEEASKGKKKRSTRGELYVASMKSEAARFGGSLLFTESIQKPNYKDGTQQYGTTEGTETDKDPLLPVIQEVFGEEANRFNLTWDQITNELLPKVKEKIQNEFVGKRITVPNFEVILTPALVSNLQTTLNHPENSQTNTYEWTSTILSKQDETDSGYRLLVGDSETGGAGCVDGAHRENRWDDRGFRLSVVFEK